ncbi:hypothetical protein V1512DRAFT_249418 [Lipomyces arxii]|uniref:uncharacterized protein n=1 Tax=Lipomyces arxii TaxID=56418 RepID=UPI0034CDC166
MSLMRLVEGIPFIRVQQADDIKSHFEALVQLLESDQILPDPRTWMNLDAAKLYFGDADKKKSASCSAGNF